MRSRSSAILTVLALFCGFLPGLSRAQDRSPLLPELKREELSHALDVFKIALDERWSYRHANAADFDAAIAALRKRVEAGISSDELGIELQRIIALGIDGHARVSGYRLPPGGCLPFLIEAHGDRFVAFHPERRSFLADGFPFLTKIDGKPVGEWCAAAAGLVPKGSPQYIRHRCLGLLRELDYWRGLMNLPKKDRVEVELADQDGRARKTLTLPVAQSPLASEVWPLGGSRRLEGNIGYLRLASMDETTSVPEIKQWMPKLRDTAGLIVDVRDNNGGERDALLLLYSYLAAPDDPPRVFTAAAYRLHSAHKENHLAENHFMYRADAKEWSPKDRQAIVEFTKTFKPQWELPKGQFSDWHYMVLRRRDDPDIFHYGKPVMVLMNAKCFSATDIFLAGLKGMKNVTLLGTPSSGGSAYTQEVPLGATPFVVRIGSMASFQADGKLFDRNGVQPDVVVEPVPEYYIGGRDNVLEEAVTRILAQAGAVPVAAEEERSRERLQRQPRSSTKPSRSGTVTRHLRLVGLTTRCTLKICPFVRQQVRAANWGLQVRFASQRRAPLWSQLNWAIQAARVSN